MSGKLRWLGGAFIEYVTPGNKRILFDPWTKSEGNKLCPYDNQEFENTDLILVSHDHFDHIGSAVPIVKLSKAQLGGPDETMKRLYKDEGLSPDSVVNNGAGYIVGGGFENKWIKVVTTPAHHTSNTSMALGTIGMIINGPTIYHAGDTSIVAEMEIYGRLYPIDMAILPIFSQAMMDYIQATEAVRLLKPQKVLPIHFDFCHEPEFELQRFVSYCREKNSNVEVIETQKDVWYEI